MSIDSFGSQRELTVGEATYTALHGAEEAERRVGGGAKRDTLCYATQVNQDALGRALQHPLDQQASGWTLGSSRRRPRLPTALCSRGFTPTLQR